MTLPRHPGKLDEPELVTPAASVAHFYDEPPPPAPDAVVLCYHDGLFEHAAEAYDTTPFPSFGEGNALDATGGTVGALQPGLGVGDVVVVDRALRDEGTSHHYLEPTPYVDADDALRGALEAALDASMGAPRVGPTWTTDAPHRETSGEVERYRDESVLTVDMEAAGVFAVAEYRGVRAGAAFTVSDVLDVDGREPAFDETRPHLRRLLDGVVDGLRTDADASD